MAPVISDCERGKQHLFPDEINKFFADELAELEFLLRETSYCEGLTGRLTSYLLKKKGKRIRPLLLLLSASLQEKKIGRYVLEFAAAVELIHTASLIHDDIIDRSSKRRGSPSLNYLYGNHLAVLAGDFLFARAFHHLSSDPVLLRLMTKVITLMCQGEVEQGASLYRCNITREEYWARVYKKTAFFLGACCWAGGYLAGKSLRERELLERYGMELGKAFQLVDDLLDFTGSSGTTGKPVASDLLQGIVTLPVIELMQDEQWKNFLKDNFAKEGLTQDKVFFLCHALEEKGVLAYLFQQAQEKVVNAQQMLYPLPPFKAREHLHNLADCVVQRSY